MKLKNIGRSDFVSEGVSIKPGESSDNIDDILARQLVADNPGHIAMAPESEHTADELAHADEKKKPEPTPEPESEPEPTSGGGARLKP